LFKGLLLNGSKLKIIILTLSAFLGVLPLQAQEDRSVTGATLMLSVDDWTQVFLNGHQIAEFDPRTFSGDASQNGVQTIQLSGDQLCYFESTNVLALVMTQTLSKNSALNEGNYLGIGYVLTVTFSDKKQSVYSSNEADQHLEFEVDSKTDPDPTDWTSQDFDDSGWHPAQGGKPSPALAVTLLNPDTHQPAVYLQCIKSGEDGIFGTLPGARVYFRRKIAMYVVPPPGCPQPRPPSKPKPTATPVPPRPTATFTFTFTPTFTWTPRPQPTRIPPPRPTATPIPRRPPPTAIPIHQVRYVPPTWTHTRVYILPTPTNTPRRRAWPTAIPVVKAKPTETFTSVPVEVQAMPETIVFVNPPVNIYVQFGDGPGQYKLEVTDAQGNHLKTLMDRHITGDEEQWLSWDGKNEQGQLMTYGEYYATFTRNGVLLRHIVLTWIQDTGQ
jgi:hypothetical protein